MGLLIDGQWHDQWYDTKSHGGKFVRSESQFRKTISTSHSDQFSAESGRYHLYVSLACPWAHRALIMRQLKSLESHISVSVVNPKMLAQGWSFEHYPGATGDKLYQLDYLHQLYTKTNPEITTRVTVPVLWDKKEQTIVNNESSEIMRIFNSAFNHITNNQEDFYPTELRHNIDQINDFVYHKINNGVYKAGFATTQTAYLDAVTELFNALDNIELRLSESRYLVDDRLTEADWRLFTTLIRFDAVYVNHFKCNLKRIADYPNLQNYLRELYQYKDIRETVNFDHIKCHYYYSHKQINPTQIIPAGPVLNLNHPHNRDLI
ncbi:glutathione S-transferase family protein [Gayadomonas joobiniege]|uniref:glutathione S-transferase family protein n=1 Tax=Gayadomonas joobiniege TaxID=1234606 RepID=UPI00035F2ED7|nr:glutathione S-transferase family protein [Gayadomonas joobiniege]